MTIEEVKAINRRKFLLEWQTKDSDGGELRLAEDKDWEGCFTNYQDGLRKFRTTGHLCISMRYGREAELMDTVIVTTGE